MVRITVLVDNAVGASGLLAEHGAAYWVESGRRRILFDTGQGDVLRHNAEVLGISLDQADTVVLSHGHYDHACGLRCLHANSGTILYAHPAAFRARYSLSGDSGARAVGMLWPDDEKKRWENSGGLVLTSSQTEVADGIQVTGEIPRITHFEDNGGEFYLDAAGTLPDGFEDDQAMFFEVPQGLVILLGCAHAGVINTVEYIRQLTGGVQVYAIIGGMHLVHASSERLNRTCERIAVEKPAVLAPAHCTGEAAGEALRHRLPEQCVRCRAGAVFEF